MDIKCSGLNTLFFFSRCLSDMVFYSLTAVGSTSSVEPLI